MPFLSQHNFPQLWLFMQKTIGGNQAKQQLAIRHFQNESKILEIGCSVGNIAEIFTKYQNITYTGIDIDTKALEVAQKIYKSFKNFSFKQISLSELAKQEEKFDYMLFSGILHHVNDDELTKLISDAMKLVNCSGKIIISEPEAVRPSDNRLFKLFYNLEQGQFLRSRAELERLILATGIQIDSSEDHLIYPGILKNIYVARFNLLSLKNHLADTQK